jgi:hypothetical protein
MTVLEKASSKLLLCSNMGPERKSVIVVLVKREKSTCLRKTRI